jgi:hypothetical protein
MKINTRVGLHSSSLTRLATAALCVGSLGLLSACSGTSPAEPAPITSPAQTTRHAEASFITDIADQRKLAGIADNIFTGTVIEQVGTKTLDDAPATQFTVEVGENLKGELAGQIVVNQNSGVNLATNELILLEGDPLLTPGQAYLFATRYETSEDWNTVVPNFGKIPLSPDEARAAEDPTGSETPDAVAQMLDSIANQEPLIIGDEPVAAPEGRIDPDAGITPPESAPPTSPTVAPSSSAGEVPATSIPGTSSPAPTSPR